MMASVTSDQGRPVSGLPVTGEIFGSTTRPSGDTGPSARSANGGCTNGSRSAESDFASDSSRQDAPGYPVREKAAQK